jgi:hypothetical protein
MTETIDNLSAIFDEHVADEFVAKDVAATMATMAAEPFVNHVPTMMGGVGAGGVADFYDNSVNNLFLQVRHDSERLSPQRVRRIAESRVHHRPSSLPGPVLRRRPQMRVGVQRRRRIGVPERPLDRHHIAPLCDQAAGVEVP